MIDPYGPHRGVIRIACYFLIFMFISNVAFGNAFMQIILFGLPLNEVLICGTVAIFTFLGLLRIPGGWAMLFYLWLVVSLVFYLPFGLFKYGIVAGRDATQVLDSMVMLATYSVVCRLNGYRVFENILLAAITFEFLDRVLLFQFNMFTISSFETVSIFGGTIGSSVVIVASFWFGVIMKGHLGIRKSNYMVLLSILLILLHQNRFLYVAMIVTGILYLLISNRQVFNRALFLKIILFVAALSALESVFSVVGASDYLSSNRLFKYGFQSVSLMGIFQHLATGVGVESEVFNGSAGGLAQRVGWWISIFATMLSDTNTLLFGMGYGMPLTDAVAVTVIREPHNSYMSVFARNGVILFSVWILFHLSVTWASIRMLRRNVSHTIEYKLLFVCLLVTTSIYITAVVEPAFELPPIAISAYMFIGISLVMIARLRAIKRNRGIG